MKQRSYSKSDFQKMIAKADLYWVSHEEIIQVSNTPAIRSHIQSAKDSRQDGKFIMVEFKPEATPKDIGEITDMTHMLRKKETLSADKWGGIIGRRFAMIYEPEAIELLMHFIDRDQIKNFSDRPAPIRTVTG